MIIANNNSEIMLSIQPGLPANEGGFTLIEVLIALIVLGVGLLGLASLQSISIKSNHDAYLRSQAQLLAYEITDRMRSNVQQSPCGTNPASGSFYTDNYNNITGIKHDCLNNSCNPTEMAEDDVYQWQDKIAKILPGGNGMICIDNNPGDNRDCTGCAGSTGRCSYLIRLTWNSAGGTVNTYKISSQIVRKFCSP